MRKLAALLILFASTAEAGQLGDWFKSLKQPGTSVSCCDISDCATIDDTEWRIVDGDYQVILGGEWVKVPEQTILHRSDNPTGKGVLCANYGRVLCFDPGPLS